MWENPGSKLLLLCCEMKKLRRERNKFEKSIKREANSYILVDCFVNLFFPTSLPDFAGLLGHLLALLCVREREM